MINFDKMVDVGDEKKFTVDLDGVPTVLEAEFTSPSGTETKYELSDFDNPQGNTFSITHPFNEAGHWFVTVLASNPNGQESESGFIRARTNQTINLSILTFDQWPQYMPESVMRKDPKEIQKLVNDAEKRVVNRYRQVDTTNHVILDRLDGRIELDGYVEKVGSDEIDLQESEEDLVDALRTTIANIVQHYLNMPDEAEYVTSMSEGSRSVSFKENVGVPSSIYNPLLPYDSRSAYF